MTTVPPPRNQASLVQKSLSAVSLAERIFFTTVTGLPDPEVISSIWQAYKILRARKENSAPVKNLDPQTVDFVQLVAATIGTDSASIPDTAAADARALFSRVDPVQVASLVEAIAADPQASEAVEQASAILDGQDLAAIDRLRLLLVILVWIIAIAVPVAEIKLAAAEQVIVSNEVATVALAMAITDKLKKRDEARRSVDHDADSHSDTQTDPGAFDDSHGFPDGN
jgi:hypothetical protein